MNEGTTFNHGKAIQDAEQIIGIANKVSALFQETDKEIEKEKQNLQTSTEQDSAGNAIKLYNSYKANFEGFIAQIKEKANEIYRSSATYTASEGVTNKAVDAAFKITPGK